MRRVDGFLSPLARLTSLLWHMKKIKIFFLRNEFFAGFVRLIISIRKSILRGALRAFSIFTVKF